jgi:hypothetical protein
MSDVLIYLFGCLCGLFVAVALALWLDGGQ